MCWLRLFAGESSGNPFKEFGLTDGQEQENIYEKRQGTQLEYTAFSFRDPKKAAEMFAEDGAFELPYPLRLSDFLQSTGAETRSPIFSNPCSISIPVSNSRIPRC